MPSLTSSPTPPSSPPTPREGSIRTDCDLVTGARAGDRDAFAALATRYARAARATAAHVLGDLHLARDAAQDGFISAYQNLATLRDPASFGPWLLAIVRHRALRLKKQRRALRPIDEASDVPHPEPPPSPLDGREQALLAALDRLPGHERVVVMLRYFEGYDVERIAEVTGRPYGTVTKQLSRAQQRLKSFIGRISGAPS